MGSSLIGQLRILLGLETAQFEAGSKKVKHELGAMKESAEVVKGALEALGIALSIEAVVEAAKGALEYAASLGDVAKQTGLTVEQVQMMQRAAKESGVEWDRLKVGVEKFRVTLGAAKAGLPEAVKAFKNIGIDEKQLQSFHDTDTALRPVMEGLKNVGDGATQAAAAQRLFGRSAAELTPLLAAGKTGYDAMYDSAVKAGMITSEQAEKAHDAQVAIDNLALALKTRLAIAISDNADGVVSFTKDLEALIGKISWLMSQLPNVRASLAKISLEGNSALNRAGMAMGVIPIPIGLTNIADNDQRIAKINAEMAAKPKPAPAHEHQSPPPNQLDLHAPPHRQHDHSEERAKEAERLQYELDKEDLDGKKQTIEAQRALTVDTEDRLLLSQQSLEIEHDQRALDINHNLKMVELDRTISAAKKAEAETSAKKQLALNDSLLLLKKQGLGLEAAIAASAEFEQTEALVYDNRRARLEDEDKLAQTMADRRRVEMELLDLAYEEKRAQLKRIIEAQYMGQYTHTLDDRTRAQLELDALNGRYTSEKTSVLRSTAGPLEQLRNSIPDTAAKMNEALQGVAAEGLTQLRDGLAETSASWIKMGGIAGDTLRSVYTSIMKLVLSKGLNSLIGMFGGTQINVMSSAQVAAMLPAAPIPHLAGGGSMILGGMAGIDQNLLSLNGSPLARVGRGERLDISPHNDRGGGGGLYLDLRGAVMTEDLLRQMQGMADGAAVRGAAGGAAMTTRNLKRSSRRAIR